MDNRAQSIGIGRLFLTLVVGSILAYLLAEVANPILEGTRTATTNSTANQATEWFQAGVNYFAVYVLIIAFFSLVVLAIYQREVLR